MENDDGDMTPEEERECKRVDMQRESCARARVAIPAQQAAPSDAEIIAISKTIVPHVAEHPAKPEDWTGTPDELCCEAERIAVNLEKTGRYLAARVMRMLIQMVPRAASVVPVVADMFWTDEDYTENLHDAVSDEADEHFTFSDLPVETTVSCAKRLPNIRVRITGYTDLDGWQYEVIGGTK